MSSTCISNCVNDTADPRIPIRSNYRNLHKWSESDEEFIKTVRRVTRGFHEHLRVVDSVSCRQMYLRSYSFSRKESVPEKTQKCFGRVKEKVGQKGGEHKNKGISCGALFRMFRRLLSCSASVDVVDPKD